VITPLLVIVLL